MKKIISSVLKNRNPIFFILIVIILISGYNVLSIGQSVFPKVSFPHINIYIDRGFIALKQMEMQITKPLENALYATPGIKVISSKTRQGIVELDLTFDWHTDLNQAYQSVLTKVSNITSLLPSNTKIKITKMTTSAFPVEGFSIYSDTESVSNLKQYVENTIKPNIEKISGIADFEIVGGVDKEYKVILNPTKLLQYKLNPIQISEIIQKHNDIKFLGTINQEYKMFLGISDYQLKTLKDIENIIITNIDNRTIYLKDIANISLGTTATEVVTSTNGHNAVLFNITKYPEADVLEISKRVKERLSQLKLPQDVHLSKWYDLSEFVQKSIRGVLRNLLLGMILVSLVVIIFLRNFKMSFSLLIFIPITMIIAVMIMKYLGMTLNIMSLGGLTAALGILVDNASVVVENIARYFKKGRDTNTAIIEGTSEVISPILFASLTTIAVFVPMMMLEGITGFFFKSTSITIIITLTLSLLLSIFFIPVIISYFFKKRKANIIKEIKSTLLQRKYKSILIKILNLPLLFVIISLLLGGYSVYLFNKIPSGFLPVWDEGTFIMDLDTPPGTSFAEMSRIISGVENVIKNTPVIQTYSCQIGDAAVRPNEAHFYMHPQSHKTNSTESTFDIMDNLEEKLIEKYPELNVDLHQILPDRFDDFSGKQKTIVVKVTGLTKKDVVSSYQTVADSLKRLDFIHKIKGGAPENSPVFDIKFKKEILEKLGINEDFVTSQIEIALQGVVATEVSQGINTVGIRIKYPNSYRKHIEDLENLPIFTNSGDFIPLSHIATIKTKYSPVIAFHENGLEIIYLELESETSKGNIQTIQSKLNELRLPQGVNVELAGDWKNQNQSFRQLLYITIIAGLLVFLLLLIQFKKYSITIIVFISAVLSLSFVIFGLVITHTSFNVSAFIGLIISLGIVVNNGILVVSFIEKIKENSSSLKEAIIDASLLRIRPIMITSITTIGGFLPMAIMMRNGGEMLQPLAVAVIFGLVGSVFFSLIIIPCYYMFFIRR